MQTPESTSRLTYVSYLVVPISTRDHVRVSGETGEIPERALVEYGDYECPYCRAAQDTVKEVQRVLGDGVAFVFRHFPLANIHPLAWKAAEAAEAAGEQGSFWEMHDRLFQRQEALEQPDLIGYARDLGLDVSRFTLDLTASMHSGRVDEDFRSGVLSGVNGTPTFFIDGVRYEGSHDFDALLNALRA